MLLPSSNTPSSVGKMERKNSLTIRFCISIFFVYLLTAFFYLFPVGEPQVSHFILALGIAFLSLYQLLRGQFPIGMAGSAALFFGCLTFFVNIAHFMALPDTGFILSSLYYIFDACIFIFIILLFRHAPESMEKVIYVGLALALAIQISYIHTIDNPSLYRVIGTFRNPNQLAYWSLFSACLLILIRTYKGFRWYDFVIFFGYGYLQTLAVSKAGIISFFVLLLCLPFSKMVSRQHKGVLLFFSTLFLVWALFSSPQISETFSQVDPVSRVIERIYNIGSEQDDNARARGYYRIVEHWPHLFLGAGEGAYERFSDMEYTAEIHSGIINVVFSYGVLGLFAFSFFLYCVTKRSPQFFLVILFVILLNGITHQNIRFTYFWIVMAVAYSIHYTNPHSLLARNSNQAKQA